MPWRIIIYQTRLVSRIRKIVSVKFHKADDTATKTGTDSLKTPMPNPVEKEEDAPHKRAETTEISLAK